MDKRTNESHYGWTKKWGAGQRRHARRGGPAAAAVVQRLVCQGLSADWGPSYRRVASVLRATVRASSAVEGLNSILRMHQARHRGLSQELLDLKRLYWNCHPSVPGGSPSSSQPV
ncbi:hypothetical protein BH23PLA1_BH23PLA1_18730 [soil metagenome]